LSDLVAMTAKTTFHNPRLRSDRNGLVEAGDRFETDLAHARDLQRLDHLAGEAVHGLADAAGDVLIAMSIICGTMFIVCGLWVILLKK